MRNRLPKPQSIVQVYAVIAFLLSAWTITAFIRKLSTWLLFLNLGEIFTVFSYAMLTNLIESLLVILLLLLASAILPPRLLRDDFIVRGTILAMGLIGSLMVYLNVYIKYKMENKALFLTYPLAMLCLMIFLLILSARFHWLHSVIDWISDHLMVFLLILVPVFVILSGYVLLRNIV